MLIQFIGFKKRKFFKIYIVCWYHIFRQYIKQSFSHNCRINFDIIGDVITNISFIGGCDGNLKAISKLCNGMTVSEIENKLLGNDCKGRGTSCADQFAKAVREAFNSNKQ